MVLRLIFFIELGFTMFITLKQQKASVAIDQQGKVYVARAGV